jgi:hypothetical protein
MWEQATEPIKHGFRMEFAEKNIALGQSPPVPYLFPTTCTVVIHKH